MSGSRPWWASDGPVDGGVDPGQDPLDVHRAARRGEDRIAEGSDPPPPSGSGEPSGSDHGSGWGHAPGSDHGSGTIPPEAGVCGICPVCIAARIVGESHPELLAHLVEAGRHLTAAVRTFLEPADRSGHGPEDSDRVRRIDLD